MTSMGWCHPSTAGNDENQGTSTSPEHVITCFNSRRYCTLNSYYKPRKQNQRYKQLDSFRDSIMTHLHLILTLYITITGHTISVAAFTARIHTAPRIIRRRVISKTASSILYATVSKPSSSKPWTGGYVPIHQQRDIQDDEDEKKNSEIKTLPLRSDDDHTGIIAHHVQEPGGGVDPAAILAKLHTDAHNHQQHINNNMIHTVSHALVENKHHSDVSSDLQHIQVVKDHTILQDPTIAHSVGIQQNNNNKDPTHVKIIASDVQHIQVTRENDDSTLQVHPVQNPVPISSSTEIQPQSLTLPNSSIKTAPPVTSVLEGPKIGFETSCVLTQEQIAPLFTFQKKSNGKVKVLNAFSLYTIFICVLTMPLWALSMYLVDAYSRSNPEWDPHRTFFDKTGKIWCKIYLTLTNSYPTISGDLDRLKEKMVDSNSSCLFVANHASFLDIAVLCTVLDPVFKFIAKSDLKAFPFIGQQLTGGKHILIDRNDRRSQLRAFKEGVAWLQQGVPLMAFPEGTRSKDGRLIDFKGGMFSMAVKSKVPIVPISISNTHAVFPSNALMPIQSGAGKLHVHVHPPIDVEGKSEEELARLVRVALLSKLPYDQHPLEGGTQPPTDDDDDDE